MLKSSRVFSKEFKINKIPSLSIFFSSFEFSIAFSREVMIGINEDNNSELAYFNAFVISEDVRFLKFSNSALYLKISSSKSATFCNSSS